jgi:predicted PurR-regulated permease PerM
VSEESGDDRRRIDRRTDFVSLAEYTVPELRKALATLLLLAVILALFTYMVHEVFVAVVAGIVAAAYLIPLQAALTRRLRNKPLAAVLTIVLFTVPLVAILAYSWIEISSAASYLDANSAEVAERLNTGLQRTPLGSRFEIRDRVPVWVERVAQSGAQIVDEMRETIDVLLIGLAVFFFTTFYGLTDHERLRAYISVRVPGRYRDLLDPVAHNIRSVIYGVLYGTFLTQLMKSALILALNLIWHVPLAVVLAIASFFIGLLPVVGSWTIYTPVAIYLMLWRGDVLGGVLMLVIGFLGNTIFLSMYLRPKIAAQKSRVLNFYWMFIALVTGVYTFGLVGIIIGPVLIAVLKAIFDTLSVPGGSGETVVQPARAP